MAAPPCASEYSGRIRFRRALLGRMIAQVEVYHKGGALLGLPETSWRDADEFDLRKVDLLRKMRGFGTFLAAK